MVRVSCGGWTRTSDLQVMSINLASHISDRRAADFAWPGGLRWIGARRAKVG